MKKIFLVLFNAVLFHTFAAEFWQNLGNKNIQVEGVRKIIPQKNTIVQLNDAAFRLFQQTIPSEQSGQSVLFELPEPGGSLKLFRIFEQSCMDPSLAASYPSIKTYQAISVDNPAVTAKIDYTEFGFHAMVFSVEGVYFIDPYSSSNTGFYSCYYKKDYTRAPGSFSVCETGSDEYMNETDQTQQRLSQHTPGIDNLISTGIRRTYRLALSCTIEYSAAVCAPNPVTKARVLSAMVTTMNRVNGVYEKDLSIHMNLVPNNDTLIFITSDNFSNSNGGALLGQNQTVCDARIGNANYDIGHIFSTGGGGVAGLGVVCVTGDKANGVTGSSNPVGDGFDIDYVAHEMGHQFGANHTFNAGSGACSGNRNGSTAYEPGSGITIMAYAGICDANDIQSNSDDFFHRVSIVEIYNYITSTSCAAITNTGNTPPVVNTYKATYYIPYKTSFEITASATDPNGKPINYLWEEWDLGPSGNWNASNNTTAPIFRSFIPSASGTRVFPRWDSLINNVIKYKGEVLPEVARDVKFRCTVKNLDVNGYGAFNAPDSNLILKSIVTPSLFRVNSQSSPTTITGNTNQTITWDVAGTTASPISCANVDIFLSLDSARTFPYVLATATPNDGTHSVLIPDVVTANASARIKVKGSGNVFFDLNDSWIKINQGTPPAIASFTSSNTNVCQGATITFTNTSTGNPDSVRWTINGGLPFTSNSMSTVQSTFNISGIYTIRLIAYKAGIASSPFTTTVQINPIVTTRISSTICNGQSVTVGSTTYNTTGIHTTVLQTSLGCDSTVILTLTVNPTPTTNISSTICNGQSVTVGSSTYTTSGIFNTVLQTSLGCDSTVILNLTVNPTPTTNISRTICNGQSVTVGSTTYSTSGIHTTVLQTSLGCDSTVVLNLTVNPTPTTNISRTICNGQSVTIGSSTYNTTGTFTTVLQTSLGCDSTVVLNLTVNPTPTTNISRTICNGQSVTVGSSTYNTTGIHTTVLQTSLGCDSTVILNLTVNPTPTTNFSSTICEGQSVTVGTNSYSSTGLYTTVLQTSLGCDSTVILNLTVNPTPTTNISRTICEGQSVTVGSTTYTTTGTHTTVLQTSLGCDSTVVLNLSVNPTATTNISRTICEGQSVTIGSTTYTTTGTHTTVLQTSLGCDSTVILTLTVNPTPTTNISRTICEGQSVTVGSTTYTATGTHTTVLQTSLGCDSTVILNLTVNAIPQTPVITQSNDTLYSNVIIAGATYYWYKSGILITSTFVPYYKLSSSGAYTVKIINNDCESAESVAFNAVFTSVRVNSLNVNFSITPNPSNGQFMLNITSVKSDEYQLVLFNVAGQAIKTQNLNINRGINTIPVNLDTIEKGMYFISLRNQEGISTQNIIIQ